MQLFTDSSVQSLSRVQLFASPWPAAHQASLSITSSWSLLKLMYIELVMPSNHLILCCPLFLLPKSFPASGSFPISQFFTSDGQSIGALALASVLPVFRTDFLWFDLLAVQGTLKNLLQQPQFKSINSLALSLLYGPILTSIHL